MKISFDYIRVLKDMYIFIPKKFEAYLVKTIFNQGDSMGLDHYGAKINYKDDDVLILKK